MFGEDRSVPFRKRVDRAWLAVNAWLDASHFETMRELRDLWSAFAARMDGLHVSGVARFGVEAACEALTLGLAGLVALLTLAQPAFRETTGDWLKKQDLAVNFVDRYGAPVGRRGILHDSVPLSDVPDMLIKAVLATEDRRFFDHWGIDPIGTARALTVNARSSGVVQGGSTLTQQLAKNLFLSNERTIERKVKEAFLAVWLEFHLTKREILELYLDRAYMGGGAFGVQAASEFYFGKSVRDVTLAEAAMLAGLFKAPTKFAPHVNLPAARARAADVLNNLVDAGFMAQSQVFGALRDPATPVDRSRETSSPDWYLDWAYGEVKAMADAGKLGAERVLTVRLALDSALQRRAEETIETQLRDNGRAYNARQAATVILQPDGAVRAIVGGRDYGASQFNRATDALRQVGSSFKPYVYLTALLSGRYKPSTVVVDSPVCLGNWCPRNYGGGFAGALPLASALARSLNTVAVKLSIGVGEGRNEWERAKSGRSRILNNVKLMGITAAFEDTPSLPLGQGSISVLEHANAYAVFANGGKRAPAWAASEILNSRGETIWRQDADGEKPRQIFPAQTIAEMDSMLFKVVEEGTGRRAMLPKPLRVGGKTGTTNGYKDAWFCGFTGNYVGCVWYGNDDDTAMNSTMTGGALPAQTWHDIMEFAHRGVEPVALPGEPPPAPAPAPAVAASGVSVDSRGVIELGAPARPQTLSRRSAAALGSIEQLIRVSGQRADAGGDETGVVTPIGGARAVGGRIRIP